MLHSALDRFKYTGNIDHTVFEYATSTEWSDGTVSSASWARKKFTLERIECDRVLQFESEAFTDLVIFLARTLRVCHDLRSSLEKYQRLSAGNAGRRGSKELERQIDTARKEFAKHCHQRCNPSVWRKRFESALARLEKEAKKASHLESSQNRSQDERGKSRGDGDRRNPSPQVASKGGRSGVENKAESPIDLGMARQDKKRKLRNEPDEQPAPMPKRGRLTKNAKGKDEAGKTRPEKGMSGGARVGRSQRRDSPSPVPRERYRSYVQSYEV